MPDAQVRVAILDDHQPILDGYAFRLAQDPAIEIVAAVHFGSELEAVLARRPVDVILLDVSVPTAPDNRHPYPILHVIPDLLQRYPNLAVLVISMTAERALIRALLEAGISGYLLKDDAETLRALATVVATVASGGVCFSQQAYQWVQRTSPQTGAPPLTPRQLEALSVCAAYPGATLARLAQRLGVQPSTLRNLLSDAYLRLEVSNRTEAVLKAQHLGLITRPT